MSTIAERLSAVDTKLNNILTNANTQLTNKGKTAVSDLSDLPSAVGELKNPTGTKSITQNGTVDVSQYASANVNVPTPTPALQSKSVTITENGTTTITPDSGYDGLDEVEVTTNVSGGTSEYNAKIYTDAIDNPNITYPNVKNIVKECPAINLGSYTTCQSFFLACYYLEKVELFDTSNVTSMKQMFQNCASLKNIPQFNSSKVTDMSSMFQGDTLLETIPILDTHLVAPRYMTNMYQGCPNLTNESLNNILYMIAHCGSGSAYRTLYNIGLSQSQATTCTGLSNWASAQSAGWTTGY